MKQKLCKHLSLVANKLFAIALLVLKEIFKTMVIFSYYFLQLLTINYLHILYLLGNFAIDTVIVKQKVQEKYWQIVLVGGGWEIF